SSADIIVCVTVILLSTWHSSEIYRSARFSRYSEGSVKQRKLRNVVQSRKSCRGRRIPFSARRKSVSDLPASLTETTPYPIRPLCAAATALKFSYCCISVPLHRRHLCNSARVGSDRGKFKTTTIRNVEVPDWITSA